MTFVFAGLTEATISLAAAYLILSIVIARRLLALHRRTPDLNTRKLFVMSCLLSSILRTMSFTSMAVLDYCEIKYQVESDAPNSVESISKEVFFEKAELVMFDFPDFCIISAYILLLLAWAEGYLESRRHWLSSIAFRRVWLLTYLVLNIFIYGSQVGIYSLLFIPKVNQRILSDLIYLTLTAFNLGLPMIWILALAYLTYKFAGFPYSSIDAKLRLSRLSFIGSVWTVSRLLYGMVALTSVLQDFLFELKRSKLYYSLLLGILFLFCEIIPILITIRGVLLDSFTNKPGKDRDEKQVLLTPDLPRLDSTNSDEYAEFVEDFSEHSSPAAYAASGANLGNPLISRSIRPVRRDAGSDKRSVSSYSAASDDRTSFDDQRSRDPSSKGNENNTNTGFWSDWLGF